MSLVKLLGAVIAVHIASPIGDSMAKEQYSTRCERLHARGLSHASSLLVTLSTVSRAREYRRFPKAYGVLLN